MLMEHKTKKLVSWNVNGLRACMGKGFAQFLEAESPDVICLQETKMQREQADFSFPGYHEYWTPPPPARAIPARRFSPGRNPFP